MKKFLLLICLKAAQFAVLSSKLKVKIFNKLENFIDIFKRPQRQLLINLILIQLIKFLTTFYQVIKLFLLIKKLKIKKFCNFISIKIISISQNWKEKIIRILRICKEKIIRILRVCKEKIKRILRDWRKKKNRILRNWNYFFSRILNNWKEKIIRILNNWKEKIIGVLRKWQVKINVSIISRILKIIQIIFKILEMIETLIFIWLIWLLNILLFLFLFLFLYLLINKIYMYILIILCKKILIFLLNFLSLLKLFWIHIYWKMRFFLFPLNRKKFFSIIFTTRYNAYSCKRVKKYWNKKYYLFFITPLYYKSSRKNSWKAKFSNWLIDIKIGMGVQILMFLFQAIIILLGWHINSDYLFLLTGMLYIGNKMMNSVPLKFHYTKIFLDSVTHPTQWWDELLVLGEVA